MKDQKILRVILFTVVFSILQMGILFSEDKLISQSGIIGIGGLTPDPISPLISIEKISMDIKFDGSVYETVIEYKINNKGKASDVLANFPVFYLKESLTMLSGYDDNSPWGHEQFFGFEVSLNGTNLPFIESTHALTEAEKTEYLSKDLTLNSSDTASAHWYGTTLPLPAKKTSTVKILFHSAIFYEDWDRNDVFFDSPGERQFYFTFKPSANFGNGVINAIDIKIDFNEAIKNGYALSTPGLKETKGITSFSLKNVDSKSAAPIKISWISALTSLPKNFLASRLKASAFQSITASSTLIPQNDFNYGLMNLLDNRLDTCWSEGVAGSGKGEWVELVMKPGYEVYWIGIANGYLKNTDTFKNNHLIKFLQVELTYDGGKIDSKIIQLPKKPLTKFNNNNIWDVVDIIRDLGNPGNPGQDIEKIKLKILDVYPTAKDEDACISEVYVMGAPVEVK